MTRTKAGVSIQGSMGGSLEIRSGRRGMGTSSERGIWWHRNRYKGDTLMQIIVFVLILLAFALEVAAAANTPVKMNLVAAGLAAYLLSLLIVGLPH